MITKSLMRYCPEDSADGAAFIGQTEKNVESQKRAELSTDSIRIMEEMNALIESCEAETLEETLLKQP